MQHGPKTKFPKKLVILCLIFIFLVVGTIIPLSMSDGTSKFSGVDQRAAQYTIEDAWQRASGINYTTITGTLKITAENVVVDSSEKSWCNGEFKDTSEGGADNYLVTIGYRTFFGILFKTATFEVCRDR